MHSAMSFSDEPPRASQDLVPIRTPVKGNPLEMALLSMLLVAASLILPIMGPLRQLTALSVLGLFFLRFSDVAAYAKHFWFIFLFPAWVALSAIWSPVPGRTIDFAIPHVVEAFALVYFTSRLSPEQIIKSIFWTGQVVFLFFALPHIGSIEAHNIPQGFSEKNWLANQMFVAIASSLYVLFADRSRVWERGLALFCIPLAFIIVVKAESATALVLSILSILFMTVMGLFWRLVARVKMLPALLIVTVVAFALFGIIMMLALMQDSPLDVFLNAVGKDSSLTGRTELWDHAKKLIAEKPIFGIGAEGFWLPYRGDAQFLLEAFYKDIGVRFSFHNSYLEILVQLGGVGLFFMLIAEVYMLTRIVLNWWKHQNVTASFFLLFGLLVLLRSFTESELYDPLGVNKMLMFMGGMTFLAYRKGWAPRDFVEAQLAREQRGGAPA